MKCKFISTKLNASIAVLGCSDIDPADGTWVARSPGNDDVITVGCHGGNKEWKLRCIDNEWVGPGGQCGSGWSTFNYTTIGMQQ